MSTKNEDDKAEEKAEEVKEDEKAEEKEVKEEEKEAKEEPKEEEEKEEKPEEEKPEKEEEKPEPEPETMPETMTMKPPTQSPPPIPMAHPQQMAPFPMPGMGGHPMGPPMGPPYSMMGYNPMAGMPAYPHPHHYGMMMPFAHPMQQMAPLPPLMPTQAAPVKKDDNSSSDDGKDDDKTDENGKKKKKGGGLELLASLALPVPGGKKVDGSAPAGSGGIPAGEAQLAPDSGADSAVSIAKKPKKLTRMEEMNPKEKLFVDKVRECDVLCGRGGKSNHHPGNKRYRQVVSEMKRTYQSTGAKTAKTDLSRAIVEHVVGYGGRFIKRDEGSGQYFLLTKAQARRKTSQALRETKELKWTM